LELRNAARQDRRFAQADFVRERLAESGIEVRDTPDGSEWLLAGEGTAGPEAGA
jgi:cysteinyl-tRNA synthetase